MPELINTFNDISIWVLKDHPFYSLLIITILWFLAAKFVFEKNENR